jgi:hypothetical protein
MAVVGEDTRRKLKFGMKGYTGTKVYKVTDFDGDVDDAYDVNMPVYGDPWSSARPYLRCVSVDCDEGDGGFGIVTANYSTERELAESFVDITKSFGMETVEQMAGYIWHDAGTPVETSIPTSMPVIIWTIKQRLLAPPDAAIRACIDHVNADTFFGCAPGYLRCDGADTDSGYAVDGSVVSSSLTYKFTEKVIPHNWAWRPPLQSRNATQQPRFYQGEDAAKPDYTADDTLIGTRVYVSGTAGTGSFDVPEHGGLPRYASINFSDTLGLPGD